MCDGLAAAEEPLHHDEEERDEEDAEEACRRSCRRARRCRSRAARPSPAPVAIASGSTPRPNASEVIRIGRRRSRTAASSPRRGPCPRSRYSLANCDDEDGVLARQAHGREHRHLEVDVALHAAQHGREHRAEDAERHDQQHRGGHGPALVQRGEAQEHDQQRQRVEQRRLRARGALLVRLARSTPCRCPAAAAPRAARPRPSRRPSSRRAPPRR